MKDLFNTDNIKGWLKITAIDSKGNEHILVDRKNALVSNAKTIIANALAATPGFFINLITCYKLGGVLAARGVTITFPSVNQITFSAFFDQASFNDTLDEVRLGSTVGGDFSQVIGLSVFKDNTLQLTIDWQLTIT